jgi:hypothetical protein
MGDSSEIRPSRQTLEATFVKASNFLRGAGVNPLIRSTLSLHGYRDEDHATGWRLMLAAGGYQAPTLTATAPASAGARLAMGEVNDWHHDAHRLVHATLQRRFPEQDAFLLEGIGKGTGMGAVAESATLLDRMETLESGEGRSGSRKEDKAAFALLTERSFPDEKRKKIRALIELAQQGEAAAPSDPAAEQAKAAREQSHEDALLELRHWYEEWSEIARVVVTRRDHLIQLGLAKRKTKKKEG